jgi:hypothetical protein
MNERIKQLIDAATFVGDRYALPEELALQLAQSLVKDTLELMHSANINRCALTTYDQGVMECGRAELIQAVKTAYGVDHVPTPKNVQIFPVKTVKYREQD